MNDNYVATVKCPVCQKRMPLMDSPEYKAGEQPRRYPRTEPITFPCCGDPQTVPAESVEYLPKSQL